MERGEDDHIIFVQIENVITYLHLHNLQAIWNDDEYWAENNESESNLRSIQNKPFPEP